MKIKGITVTTHYPKSDPKFQGDYYEVDVAVRAADGREFAAQYGDYYHDKGHDKVEGFVDAVQTILGPKIPVIRYNVADVEDY